VTAAYYNEIDPYAAQAAAAFIRAAMAATRRKT